MLFLGNPPYATANEAGAKGKSKQGVAKTLVGEMMKDLRIGNSSQQLLAQFIWRIAKIKKDFNLPRVVIAFFIKPLFFTSSEYWREFKRDIFSNFGFRLGFLFPAGDFADVSANWGVSFVVFDSEISPANEWDENQEHSWKFDALFFDRKKGKISSIGTKFFSHWPNDKSLSIWIREPIANLKPVVRGWDCAQLSSGLRCSTADGEPRGSLVKDSLGYMVNVANNIYNSSTDTWIVSSSAYKANGVNITKDNFERCCVNFAVRRLVIGNWVVDKDEYHKPDITIEGYKSFENDCVVFSLFNAASNQTSVKDLEGKNGKRYTFTNEWFPFSKKIMLDLADKHGLEDMYNEAISDRERFVYLWLQGKNLSKEATEILDAALKIVKETFPYRQQFNFYSDGKSDPLELHLMRWDAGWYQINYLLKNIKLEQAESVKAFKVNYLKLGNKIRPQIFKYGILKDPFGHFVTRPEEEEKGD